MVATEQTEATYRTFIASQEVLREARTQVKVLRDAGEGAAAQAKSDTHSLPLAERLAAIRAAWVPFDQAIAEIDVEGLQVKSDAAWNAYEKARGIGE